MSLYKMQITAHNLTAHKILKNKVDLILPKFQTERRNKRAIFRAIISGCRTTIHRSTGTGISNVL